MSFGWGSTQRPLVVASRGDHAAGHHEVGNPRRHRDASRGRLRTVVATACHCRHHLRAGGGRVINGAAPTDYDVVVVGSGIAGLSAALSATPSARVAVVTKGA